MNQTNEQLKANRLKWIEALRSGKYQQYVGGCLVDPAGDGLCCLGVYATIGGLDPHKDPYKELERQLGLSVGESRSLVGHGVVELNDALEESFTAIASHIEANMIDNRDKLFIDGTLEAQ